MLTLQKMIDGTPIDVVVGSKTFKLKQPTSAIRDEAAFIEAKTARYLRMTDDEIIRLSELPPPQEEIDFYNTLIDQQLEKLAASDDSNVDMEAIKDNADAMKPNMKLRTAATSIINAYSQNKRNKFLAKQLLIEQDFDKLLPNEQDAIVNAAGQMYNDLNTLPFLSENH